MRILVAFDFDHTIAEENTDTFILNVLNPDQRSSVPVYNKSSGWTAYMGEVFRFFHEAGVKTDSVREQLNKMPLVPGMHELLRYLNLERNVVDCIIVSDSNSLFIPWVLQAHGLLDVFSHDVTFESDPKQASSSLIYTNPAWIDRDDCLQLAPYHENSWCRLSAKNMCKGVILQHHIERLYSDPQETSLTPTASGTESSHNNMATLWKYDHILFVGDGQNDYCPSLRLRRQDYMLARDGYRLAEILAKNPEKVSANVVVWKDARDILQLVKNLVKNTVIV